MQLCNTQQVCDELMKQQNESNKRREKLGLDPITTIVLEHRYTKGSNLSNYRVVKNITSYYNFFNTKEFEFRTVFYSNLTESRKVKYKDENQTKKDAREKKSYNIKLAKEKVFVNVADNYENILRKKNLVIKLQTEPIGISSAKKEIKSQSYCKIRCRNCEQKCSFSLLEIKDKSLNLIKTELKRHNHPTSRIIDKKQRNKSQCIDELYKHYENSHFNLKL